MDLKHQANKIIHQSESFAQALEYQSFRGEEKIRLSILEVFISFTTELIVTVRQKMIGIAIAFVLAAVFGLCFYWARRITVRTPDQMRRFLDRRFDVIRRKGFWGEKRDYIDEAMIKRWGHIGWLLIPLPSFNLSLSIDQFWSLEGLSSVLLLVYAGMLFGDSRAGVHFMRLIGVTHYKREVEQAGRDNPNQLFSFDGLP